MNLQQLRVAKMVALLSLGCGFEAARIPKHELLATAVWMDRHDVSKVIAELVSMRLLKERGEFLEVELNAEMWQVKRRWNNDRQMDRGRAMVRALMEAQESRQLEFCSTAETFEMDPLGRALAEVAREEMTARGEGPSVAMPTGLSVREQITASLRSTGVWSEEELKVAAGRVPDAHEEVPAACVADGRVKSVGESPTSGGRVTHCAVGESPTANHTRVRAPDVQNQIVRTNVLNVAEAARGGTRRFADSDKQAVMERIEALCAGSRGFRFFWWVSKVRDLPTGLMLEAVGDTTTYLRDHKCKQEPGAVLWRYVQRLANERGIMLEKPLASR